MLVEEREVSVAVIHCEVRSPKMCPVNEKQGLRAGRDE